MKADIWDGWAYSGEAAEPAAVEKDDVSGTVIGETLGDLRHSRRRPIRTNAEIVDWHCLQVMPDIAAVVDASPDGILFQSEREYRLGMELLVRFPYPCASSPKQRGRVVRVTEQPEGSRRVAVRFG
jgi:hypothetical protein